MFSGHAEQLVAPNAAWKVPTAQLRITPPSAYVPGPATHAAADTAPALGVVRLGGHGSHGASPETLLYEPAPHGSHAPPTHTYPGRATQASALALRAGEELPAGQSEHTAPSAKVPTGHESQFKLPVSSHAPQSLTVSRETAPATHAHAAADVEFAGDELQFPHASHGALPAAALKVPAGHGAHALWNALSRPVEPAAHGARASQAPPYSSKPKSQTHSSSDAAPADELLLGRQAAHAPAS